MTSVRTSHLRHRLRQGDLAVEEVRRASTQVCSASTLGSSGCHGSHSRTTATTTASPAATPGAAAGPAPQLAPPRRGRAAARPPPGTSPISAPRTRGVVRHVGDGARDLGDRALGLAGDEARSARPARPGLRRGLAEGDVDAERATRSRSGRRAAPARCGRPPSRRGSAGSRSRGWPGPPRGSDSRKTPTPLASADDTSHTAARPRPRRIRGSWRGRSRSGPGLRDRVERDRRGDAGVERLEAGWPSGSRPAGRRSRRPAARARRPRRRRPARAGRRRGRRGRSARAATRRRRPPGRPPCSPPPGRPSAAGSG